MPYTIWSRGRLLGESDLGFVQIFENVRFGWFRPSPEGEQLMHVLTGAGPALMKLHKMMRNPLRQLMRGADGQSEGGFPRDIKQTTAYADLVSLIDEREALELELRGPDGKVIETDDIGIDDTEWKTSLASGKKGAKPRVKPIKQDDQDQSFPRFQIQVHLRGVPRRCVHDVRTLED
jgi:hypothetical protein